jgi:phage minor structural protein
MIFLFDKKEKFIGALSNKNSKMCPYTTDLLKENLETGGLNFEGSVPLTHPSGIPGRIEVEGYVVVENRDGGFVQLRIKKVEETKDNAKKMFWAENAALELRGDWVRPANTTLLSPRQSVDYILDGTRYQSGIIEVTEPREWDFPYVNKIAALQMIKLAYSSNIRFRVVMKGQRIVARYVDLLKPRGKKTNHRFEYRKDIVGLRRVRDSNNLITAVIATGTDEEGNQFTISDVDWKTSSGHPVNKPIGQDWVGDDEALQKWGINGKHIYGYYESTTAKTPQALIDEAWKYLQENKEPKPDYEITAHMIDEVFGEGRKRLQVGDTVAAFDKKFQPPVSLEARILELWTSETDPSKEKITLGEYRELTVRTPDQIKRLQEKLKIHKKVIDKKTEITRSDFPPNDKTVTWVDTSTTPNVVKTWNDTSSNWEKATPTQADEVGSYDQSTIDDKDKSVFDDSTYYTDQAKQQAIDAAKADATAKASAAQAAAEEYALAKAEAERVKAEAFADGIVNEEERARIEQANANLQAAKTHAEQAATAAEEAANAYTNSKLTNYVDATLYSQEIEQLQAQIDNQIESHFFSYEPTLNNAPANDWTTNAEKQKHIGDLFYNTDTGYSYRFALDGSTYKWVLVRDEGIAKALADAAQAQDTADSKRRVFISQPTTPYDTGDLWDNSGAVYRSTVTKTSAASFSSADWVKIGDVTSANTAKDTANVGGRPSSTIEDKEGSQAKANAAKQAAINEAVQQAANNLSSTRLELEANIAEKANAEWVDGQLKAKVSQDEFEALEIGGRNYVKNSNFSTGDFSDWSVNGTVSLAEVDGRSVAKVVGTSKGLYQNVLPENGVYTFSFEVKGITTGSKARVGFLNHAGTEEIYTPVLSTDTWTKFTFTTEEILLTDSGKSTFHVYAFQGEYYITNLKVEKGNKATDWTPAPEDTEASINEKADKSTTYTKSEVNNALNSKVSTTTYTTDMNGIVTDLESHASRIGQTEQGLKSKVEETTYSQRITDLQGQINDKASSSSVSSLETRIGSAETSIEETSRLISLKANSTDVYTKTEVNSSLSNKADNSTVNAIETRIEEAEAELSVQANKIESRVTKSEFEALEVGGRNLYRYSGSPYYDTDKLSYSPKLLTIDGKECMSWTRVNNILALYKLEGLEIGSTYTFSFYAKATSDIGKVRIYMNSSTTNFYTSESVSTTWKKFSIAFELKSYDWIQTHMYPKILNSDGTYETFYLANWKIEKGNKATDWTPAPEDVDGAIAEVNQRVSSAETRITQTEKDISLKASQSSLNTTNSNVSNLTSRMSSAESELNVQADQISQRVKTTDYNGNTIASLMNQTATTILLKAQKIEFDGAVIGTTATFKGRLEAASGSFSGSLTAKNLRIGDGTDAQVTFDTGATGKGKLHFYNTNSGAQVHGYIGMGTANFDEFGFITPLDTFNIEAYEFRVPYLLKAGNINVTNGISAGGNSSIQGDLDVSNWVRANNFQGYKWQSPYNSSIYQEFNNYSWLLNLSANQALYADRNSTWARFKIGKVFLKGTDYSNSGSDTLEVRNNEDNGWATLKAIVSSQSSLNAKKNIERFDSRILNELMNLEPILFHYNTESASNRKHLGLGLENSPDVIKDIEGTGIDHYSFITYILRGLQEEHNLVLDQQKVINGLLERVYSLEKIVAA